MASHHWIMIFLFIVVGYVAGRYFPQPAQWVGLA